MNLMDGDCSSICPMRFSISNWPRWSLGLVAFFSNSSCKVAAGTHGQAAVSKKGLWRRLGSQTRQLQTSEALSLFLDKVAGWSSFFLTGICDSSGKEKPAQRYTPPASTWPLVVVRSWVVAWMYVLSKHSMSRRWGFEGSLFSKELMRWSFSCISSVVGQVNVGRPNSVNLAKLPRHSFRVIHSRPNTLNAFQFAPAAASSAPAVISNSRSSSLPWIDDDWWILPHT